MKKSLKFISISHHTASLIQRECFHLTSIQQYQWFGLLRKKFLDISGLMILSTCNRTEIYLESIETEAEAIRDFFIDNQGKQTVENDANLFETSNSTIRTLAHLLEVGNGLQSAVIGDSEVMGQMKQAWQQSIQLQAQGSLLERAIQAVFRAHKWVVNKTDYHKGTQSTAYKALKLVSNEFGNAALEHKRLLIIGAGEIILSLVRYLPKFTFERVAISNRTAEKSINIAAKNNLETYPWEKVEANDFEDFDIIISAVSNRSKLITDVQPATNKRILIDMGLPANISPELNGLTEVKRYDLDDLKATRTINELERHTSITTVKKRIRQELIEFSIWLKKKAIRNFLMKYQKTEKTRSRYSLTGFKLSKNLSSKDFELLVNRISEQFVKEAARSIIWTKPDELTVQNMSCIIEIFTNQQNQYEENRSISC